MVFLMESSPTKLDDSQNYLWVTITHCTQRVISGVGQPIGLTPVCNQRYTPLRFTSGLHDDRHDDEDDDDR